MSSGNVNNCVINIDPKLYCCRICLDTKYSKGINLVKSSHILKLLEYCVGFTVDIQNTSHVLCMKCKKKIKEFEEFKRQCEKSENLWKQFPIENNPKYTKVNYHNDLSTFIQQENTETKQEYEELSSEILEVVDIGDENSSNELNPSLVNNEVKKCSDHSKDDNHCTVKHEDTIKTYECSKCKRKYSRRKWLQKHLRKRCCKSIVKNDKQRLIVKTEDEINVKVSTNECGLCDKPLSCDLSEHIVKHHWLNNNNNLQCGLCNYCGKDFAHMITHRYTHCPKMKLCCIACDKKNFSMLSLQFHFRSVHLQKPGGYCTFCDKTFNKFKTWKRHHRMHTESNKLYVCDHCGRKYTHCPKMKLCCIACDKKNFSMLSLQFHFRSVHLQKPGGYCTFCDKTFNKFKTWKRHHRMHTESNKLYVCDHCGRKFLYRHEIRTHMINRHSDSRKYVCETCGKGFKRISTLREHVYNIHETRQPVRCEHCNKLYKCENKLKIHLRNIAVEKPFICEVCSKTFYTETILRKHMFWHTNERPFSCEVCGSKYKAKAELKVHMRKHSGELPYVCATCGKRFAASTRLKIHSTIHTGVRAHKCAHCEKSFHAKKQLLEHAVKHRNVQGVKLET